MHSVCVVDWSPEKAEYQIHTLSKTDLVTDLGRKAYQLEFLDHVSGINVPKWCCISTQVFKTLVLKNNRCLLKQLHIFFEEWQQEKKDQIETKIFETANEIRKSISAIELPTHLKDLLREIRTRFWKEGAPLVVRSSGNKEDSQEFSFAGLFDSFLNVVSFDDLLSSIRLVWASVYNDRALTYCLHNNISLDNLAIGVVIQEMVNAKVSGTAFTIDMSTGFPCIHIVSTYGIGGVVDGSETGDSSLHFLENLHVMKRVLGNKKRCFVLEGEKLREKETSQENRSCFCLTLDESKKIAKLVSLIAKKYKKQFGISAIDTEFAISQNNEIFFVQVRPLSKRNRKTIIVIDPKLKGMMPLAKGKYAVGDAVCGKVKIIQDFNDLLYKKNSIVPEDIIVTHRIANYWTQYLTKFRGIISEEGSPTSHPILVCRERNISCVLGIPNAVALFSPLSEQTITIDGFNKAIYAGKLDLVSQEFSEKFAVVAAEEIPTDMKPLAAFLADRRIIQKDGGYWLTSPNCVLSGPLKEIQINSFKKITPIICKADPSRRIDFDEHVEVVDGKIYHKIQASLAEDLQLFKGMSLESCEAFYDSFAKTLEQYGRIGSSFQLTFQNWKEYVSVFEDLCAYMWLSFMFRTYVNHQAISCAHEVGVPQYLYDECCNAVQTASFQEDNELLKDKQSLVNDLLFRYSVDEIAGLTLEQLLNECPLIEEKLRRFTRAYKLVPSDDFLSFPLDISFASIKYAIEKPYLSSMVEEAASIEEYFCDNPDLKRWILLSIQSKIIQNNAHHIRVRYLWTVRDAIIRLGTNRKYLHPNELLLASCKNIEDMLEEPEKLKFRLR